MKIKLLAIFILAMSIMNLSCSNDNDTPEKEGTVYELTLDQTSFLLKEGRKQVLTAKYNQEAANLEYNWSVENPNIVSLEKIDKFSVTVSALAVGKTTVVLKSANPELSAKCEVVVTERGAIKILALGNSFSEDAIEQNLYELAKAEGIELVIGNMNKGGCSLETHWNNIVNNTPDYSYRKIVNGTKSVSSGLKAISNVLKEEEWDFISIQQVSGHAGLYNTYGPLPEIMAYLREYASNPNVKFILHQTWAYPTNSTHGEFANYDKDQMKMYEAIINTTKRIAEENNIDIIVPSGTAVQNGRTSALGDSFCRDEFHLNMTYGRYTAACTWFEKLFGVDVRNNTYTVAGLSEFRTDVARAAAHFAVESPYRVTDLVDYKQNPNVKELTKPVYVDFGFPSSTPNRVSPFPWNNMTSTSAGASIELSDEAGTALGIELKIMQRFGGVNGDGVTTTNVPTFSMPATASNDSFFGNIENFDGQVSPKGKLLINGLNPVKKYNFIFFSARGGVGDNRETQYIVSGTNTKTANINSSSNTTLSANIENIQPTSNGEINIEVTCGPNNNNAYKFYYINAMKLYPAN